MIPGRAVDRSQPRGLRQHLQDAASAILCGGLAGMVMWASVLPIDVAKTRVQTAYKGSPDDGGLLRQLRRVYAEGEHGAPLAPELRLLIFDEKACACMRQCAVGASGTIHVQHLL